MKFHVTLQPIGGEGLPQKLAILPPLCVCFDDETLTTAILKLYSSNYVTMIKLRAIEADLSYPSVFSRNSLVYEMFGHTCL